MQRNRFLFFLSIFSLAVTLGISSWVSPGTIVELQESTPTNSPVVMSPTEDSWIIVDLPENATQLEYGTEVYRLVCKACHGDKGQGLTDDWRAQWAPEDQNCWRSKCHARNHPPDGFYMPQVPAVLGQPIKGFGTALNLYTYVHKYMPWHDRGSMTKKESWSVTAYLLKINGIDPGQELNEETAANIDLSAIDSSRFPTSVPPSQEAQSLPAVENTLVPVTTVAEAGQAPESQIQPWILIPVLAVLVVLIVIFVRDRLDAR